MVNVLRNGQENVTDVRSLLELMRGTDMSLIGRSDLLDVRTNAAAFRRLNDRSFVEHVAATNRRRSADIAAPLQKDDQRATAVVNKSPATAYAMSDDKADAVRMFKGMFDLKITTGDMNGFLAAAGPPFTVASTEIKPFRWSESPISHLAHYGHPDVWDYDLEGIDWVWVE